MNDKLEWIVVDGVSQLGCPYCYTTQHELVFVLSAESHTEDECRRLLAQRVSNMESYLAKVYNGLRQIY